MDRERVLVVSIDGVAPRFVTPATMPHLCGLVQQGASCFGARTVTPSITLPAHISMLRGIDPSVHGVLDNTPRPLCDEWPSFLRVARRAGRRSAALLNWAPIDAIVERDAVDERWFLDGGHGTDDDDRTAAAAAVVLADEPHVAFAYLVSPDNAGHGHGWGSEEYLRALGRSDAVLGTLVDVVGPECAVLVTTDHGGEGHDHHDSRPIDQLTFVVLRSRRVEPATCWDTASILDIAPTVADLAGVDPAESWSGVSLVGREQPTADHLLGLVEAMVEHAYGEALDMRAHSLQTAEVVRSAGGTDELVIAGLLHDVGHLIGDPGRWGDPDHATVGAEYLQAWLPPAVVEPIRLHVAAKRHLVATDPDYAGRLSAASTETLRQQGGPFDGEQVGAFRSAPYAEQAIALRRADDAGKVPDGPVPAAQDWRSTLARVLREPVPDPRSLRDRCRCPECVDPTSGQHLLSPGDLDGWRIDGRREGVWRLTRADGSTHHIDVESPRHDGDHVPIRPITSGDRLHDACGDLTTFRSDLASGGMAFADGLGTEPGAVLEFARRLGHVRTTNYGELFDVRNVPSPANLAYTTLGLGLHTDNPYRDPVPTVQVLHCLRPAEHGGHSRFADGLAAALWLRAEEPDHFTTLARTPVRFVYCSPDADLRALRSIIELDAAGRIAGVYVNHRSMLAPVLADAGPFYDAYRAFTRELDDPRFGIEHHLAAGQVVAFDNRRILHARTAYRSDEPRHLQGCYIDIDAVRSAVRLDTC